MTPPSRRLTLGSINQHVVEAQYAVRGELAIRSEKLAARLQEARQQAANPEDGDEVARLAHLPFDTVINANIGNPQQLDQPPITFFRQVASLLENPQLLHLLLSQKRDGNDALLRQLGYPPDVIDRAEWLLKEVKSVGAYSASTGAPGIKKSVAAFLEKRDGFPADPAHIFLSNGASAGVNTLLHVICADENSGVLVPIPQYPLYTATLSLLNGRCVPYYLEEEKAWGTNIDTIRASFADAQERGVDTRAIVVINPGNPTGASLSRDDIESVLEFAREKRLVVLADEVYQTNIFTGTFRSFKSVLAGLQKQDAERWSGVELASLHSISKGMVGECGHRGGFFELVNFDPEVEAQIYKFVSITLCPPVIGQCIVELMVNPPKPGEPSFDLYDREYKAIHTSLRQRAEALHAAFQRMEGVECGAPQGSMYLFPTIHLPARALEAAKAEGRPADEFYCLRLLEATGICVVPGSGFGQKEGTLHFRTTFLAPGTAWVERMTKFHAEFLKEFS